VDGSDTSTSLIFSSGGFNDVMQQFSGQIGRDALIIDARWSMGGWTSSIIAELMERYSLAFAAIRESDHVWPGPRWGAHLGPKALLVNHVTPSAGESFAYFFRKRGLRPLIGSRTWG
jgi:tricorn protease